jgi:hypothetical protein
MADAAFHIEKEPAVLNQEQRGNKEYSRQLSHIGKIVIFVKNAVKRQGLINEEDNTRSNY